MRTRWYTRLLAGTAAVTALVGLTALTVAGPRSRAQAPEGKVQTPVQIAVTERAVYLVDGRKLYVYAWDRSEDVVFGKKAQRLLLVETLTVGQKDQ